MSVTTYGYLDAKGEPSYEVVRTDADGGGGKTFRPRRKVGGAWVANLDGVERVPYMLPALRRAAESGGAALVVEGEKCADRLALELHGTHLVATTWHGGAGWRWPPDFAEHFRGLAAVYLLADNDQGGQAAMQRIGEQLAAVVSDVRIVDSLPGAPLKGDVYDYLESGNDIDSVLRVAEGGRPPKVDDSAAGRLRRAILTYDMLDSIPPPRWLVRDVVHASTLAAVIGKPEAGKSFIALDIALSVATGQDWHGRAVAQGPVLYCVGEGLSGMRQRVKAWAKYHHYDTLPDTAWLPRAVNLLDPHWSAGLVDVVREYRPALIVIDTLARSMPGGAENSPEDMSRVIEACDAMRRASGATVALVHHVDKAKGQPRGHSSLEGALDTAVKVESFGALVEVTCLKQKDAAHFAKITLQLRPVGDSAVVASRHLTPDTRSVYTARNERKDTD